MVTVNIIAATTFKWTVGLRVNSAANEFVFELIIKPTIHLNDVATMMFIATVTKASRPQ